MSLFYYVINWSLDTSGILLRRLDARGEKLDELGLPSRSSASLSEGWWEKMLVGEGAA